MISIREIFKNTENYIDKEIEICGWIKTNRGSKNFGFIELTDGTNFNSLQVVYGKELGNFSEIEKLMQKTYTEYLKNRKKKEDE